MLQHCWAFSQPASRNPFYVSGLRITSNAFGGEGNTAGSSKNQRSEIRRQRSGVKLISDLRLLTSVINDFNDFYDLQ
jgi:hypothetical protein